MIAYEELVVALQTWRARQGLPVGQLSGALTPPPVAAAPARAASVAPSGPRTAPPGPPAPPPRAPTPAPPHLTADETLDEASLLDDAAIDEHLAAHIDESHYENDGDNFSIPFDARAAALAAGEEADESTAIGDVPGRPTLDDMDATDPRGEPTVARGAKRPDEW